MTSLHTGQANGLAGVDEALGTLKRRGQERKTNAQRILHDWALMVALDGLIDDGARISGDPSEKRVTTKTLDATINWDTPHAYDTPGAPPNGSDYVRLRKSNGQYLDGDDIDSLRFTGATNLPTRPVQWSVDANPPGQTGDAALYSGFGDNRDEAIVRQVSVPAGTPSLTFDAQWNEELGWDFGFVQVSTDNGASYQSIACTDTTTETNPDALPTAKENVPGFTGDSAGWKQRDVQPHGVCRADGAARVPDVQRSGHARRERSAPAWLLGRRRHRRRHAGQRRLEPHRLALLHRGASRPRGRLHGPDHQHADRPEEGHDQGPRAASDAARSSSRVGRGSRSTSTGRRTSSPRSSPTTIRRRRARSTPPTGSRSTT